MKTRFCSPIRIRALLGAAFLLPSVLAAANYQVIGWNDFGIDRMDNDYSVFSLWPPGNTIHAQVIYQGKRLANATGITVTYQAVADPDGSINSTSQGKTAFWQYAPLLYGASPVVDMGLNGYPMPNATNVPMTFNTNNAWFSAEGVPITPYDNALQRRFYPLMRLIVRTNATPLATNDIVLPVSDEVNCWVCHASGSVAAAQPTNGWVWNTNPQRDYRLNILRRHDELRNPGTYPGILSSNGYNATGLYRTVVADGIPIRCTKCHSSTLVPGSGFGAIPPLTMAIHSQHSLVTDPDTGATLNSSTDRSACYHCHPGVMTKALRGVMGDSVSTNGVKQIQCQNCHGSMTLVGATNRTGYIDLPDCQSCHIGAATNATIRYTSAFSSPGVFRQPVDLTFATITNLAFGNYSLYRYSTNHGRLYCEACHGSSHAEYPADRNDNIRVLQVHTNQTNVGMLSECRACHNTIPSTGTGPHGAHEFGQNWVDGSPNHIGKSGAACNACHGSDERGSDLSVAREDRQLTSTFGTRILWRGFRVGCYLCHQGSGDLTAALGPAVAGNVSTNTSNNAPVTMRLSARDTNATVQTISLRIISQPVHGTVGVTNTTGTNWFATYSPEPGFVGTETFTFSAWNDASDSNLGTGTVVVAQGPFTLSARTLVPSGYPAGWAAPFGVLAALSNATANVTYVWNFGDGSAPSTSQNASHAYAAAGNYSWNVISSVQQPSARSTTNSGSISIGAPVNLAAQLSGGSVVLSWPKTTADALLEQSPRVGTSASWTVCTNALVSSGGTLSVTVLNSRMNFYRLRKL